MTGAHFYRPEQGHGFDHDPFKAIVAPRPIGWISTVDAQGAPNLAPYSFFNALSANPPILFFSNEKSSDSLSNCEATGEFVVNMVSQSQWNEMSATSAAVAPGVNEFELAGIEPAACQLVSAPRVANSPASLECKVISIAPVLDMHGEPSTATLVTGQVVGVHIHPDFLSEGRFNTAKARLMSRCGYLSDYAVIDEIQKMKRPRV